MKPEREGLEGPAPTQWRQGPLGPAPTQSRQRGSGRGGDGLLEKYSLWLSGLGFVLLVLLGTMVDADLLCAELFYDAGAPHRWFLKTVAPWSWLNQYGEYPVLLLATAAAVVWCGSLYRRAWMRHRRACVLLLLAVAL